MKKILSYFTLLLFAVATPAQAQLEELNGKSVTVGPALADFTPNTWYFLHQSRVGGSDKGTHSEVGELPQTGGFLHDRGTTTAVRKSALSDVPDGSLATAKAGYLVRFIASTAVEGAYVVQFGTGNYLDETLTNGTSAAITGAQDFNVYKINGVDGNFALNKWNMGAILDNNGVGNNVSFWANGQVTTLENNNNWAIHEAKFTALSDRELAMTEASAVFAEYNPKKGTFTGGTAPGNYAPEAVTAFEAAVDALAEIDGPEADDLTTEDIKARTQAVLDTYQALLLTKVPYAMTVTPGYYFFSSAMTFNETVTTPEQEDPSTGETTPGTTTTIHPKKGMYSVLEGGQAYARWMTAEAKAPFLWKVTAKGEKQYEVINLATDAKFTAVATSTAVKMSTESDSLMVFDFAGMKNDTTLYNIRLKAQAERNYFYLHLGGHAAGAGKNGNILGWATTYDQGNAGASEWFLEPVDETRAQQIIADYEPIKNAAMRYDNAQLIIKAAKSELKIALDNSTTISETDSLITAATQFSSPYTTTDAQQVNGQAATEQQVYEFLLDGKPSTYWHSKWESGNVANGTHYLQVELTSTDVTEAAIKFTRRAVANDHITKWGVYGTNTADAEKSACELLAELSTPYGTNTETLTSEAFPVKNYKYLRFYIDGCFYSTAGNPGRGYGHMSAFQLFKAQTIVNQSSQAVRMGAIYDNLKNAVAQAASEGRDITAQTFTTLDAAYKAFKAVYVDPTPLRTAIANAEKTAQSVKIGNNPGEWKDNSTVTKLNNDIATARTYDQSGTYTTAKSEQHVTTIKADSAAIITGANKVDPSKWYRFRYSTEEELTANGWSLAGGAQHANAAGDTVYYESLYGKYVTVAQLVDDKTNPTTGAVITRIVEAMEAEQAVVGTQLFYDAEADIDDKDLSKFRFIAVGDTAYIIQNKGTSMFLRAAGTSGSVTLSVHPTLFKASAMGFGRNLIAAKTLNGASNSYLHAQRANNVLVTWDATSVESNSALYIEEAEAVGNYNEVTFRQKIQPGKLYAFCYPVAITAKEGKMYLPEVEGTTVTLKEVTGQTVTAGTPFLYMKGEQSEYTAEGETEITEFEHGYDVVKEPRTVSNLVGAFVGQTIGAGKIVTKDNTLEVSKRDNTTVAGNSAYIQGNFDLEAQLTINITTNTIDGVEEVIAKANQTGNIYTLDGKLVGKGNLQTVKALGRGIYVINGVKVAVK